MAKNNVDGVYSADPNVDPEAKKFDTLSYLDVLKDGLQVMDSTATSLCMDNDIPLIVFSLMEEGNIKRVVIGDEIGTIVRGTNMSKEILKQAEERMEKAHLSLKKELATLRAGRANVAILDPVQVEYYGSPTPLNQVVECQHTRGTPNLDHSMG